MKTLTVKTIPILALALLTSATATRATDFSLVLPGGSVNWSGATWVPAGGPTNTGDTLTLSAAAQTDFYLGEDRVVGSFTHTGGTVRIRAGGVSSSADNNFSIGTLIIESGSFTFADRGVGDSALDVSVGNLNVNGGSFFLGRTGVAPSRFLVSGTTSINGGHIRLQAMTPDAHLGKVVFSESNITVLNLANNSGNYFTAPYVLKVASLEGGRANDTTITGDTPQAARPTLRIEGIAGYSANYKGLIADGATTKVRLEMAGAGTQLLSRNGGHTYGGGTEISGGTLLISNSTGSGLGTGAVVVSGGALGGSGLIALGDGNSVTVTNGGMLAPGMPESSVSSLRISGEHNGSAPTLSFAAGGAVNFTLGAGNTSSQLQLLHFTAGDLELNSTIVNISNAAEGVYNLFSFTDALGNAVASGLTEGLVGGAGFDGFDATFYYDDLAHGGIGTITMELKAIPEAGSTTLALSMLAAFSAIRLAKRLSHAGR